MKGCIMEPILFPNRNLSNLKVDLNTTQTLAFLIPLDVTVVSESGIRDPEDTVFVGRSWWGRR